MALDVKVKIELSKTTTGSIGFGTPLLLGFVEESQMAVDYTEVSDLAGVVAAGIGENTAMYNAASLVFMQENRPAKIAICTTASTTLSTTLSTLLAQGKDFRQVVFVGTATAGVADALAAIEADGKRMAFVTTTFDNLDDVATTTIATYDRTVVFVSETADAAAALVGETAGRAAGSFTYKFKTLKGVAADNYTDAQLEVIHGKNAIAYVTKAGDDVTTEGTAMSGKYIDITDSIDYVIQNIEYRIQKVFNTTAKVPYTDSGIALLEAATTYALQDAFNNGIIATKEGGTTPDYSVSFAARSATTEADRESRVYKYGSFAFTLAGAIHECHVYGEVTY